MTHDAETIPIYPTAISPTPVHRGNEAETTGRIPLVDADGVVRESLEAPQASPIDTTAFLGSFFGELARCGVRDFVISPGSRSTALAMVAFESAGDVYVDVDERGAAFFALGKAKATGNPVAVICTSGTAPANWMPAVLEAEASRVPLLLLSADRPLRLRNLEAHQTADQLALFGGHVKKFYQMPQPASDAFTLAYARQVALDACIAAHGAMPGAISCDGGPVHVNFPFEEPLKPAPLALVRGTLAHLNSGRNIPPTVVPGQVLLPRDAAGLARTFANKKALALCGEGSANDAQEAQALVSFAEACNIALLADPLSGLRCIDSPAVVDNYDTILGQEGNHGGHADLMPDVLIRFGRWPISKRATTALSSCGAVQLVVDMRDTRDATASTTTLVRTTPVAFARTLAEMEQLRPADEGYYRRWKQENDDAAQSISLVSQAPDRDAFEGAYVDALFASAPKGSLVFSASSMAIRAIDTFYRKSDKELRVLCNRGLSGIDGTLSAAFGAACAFSQATVLVGDLALLHDANALALQHELQLRARRGAAEVPSIVVVVLNNGGGGIFDMLPQRSDEEYFERLFLTPQSMEVKSLAAAFGVPFERAGSVKAFTRAYERMLKAPGIQVLEVPVPLAGVQERYGRYW